MVNSLQEDKAAAGRFRSNGVIWSLRNSKIHSHLWKYAHMNDISTYNYCYNFQHSRYVRSQKPHLTITFHNMLEVHILKFDYHCWGSLPKNCTSEEK